MVERIEQQFGNYHLLKLVGEGGFGKVHMGKHLHSDTEVAIKILDTQLISREQEEFLQEARIIAALDHPSIVHLLDCGIEGDKPFLAMNYASNGTLRQRHPNRSRVPLQQVVAYVKPIASALDYAHERGLIHRDIKPENMLLGSHDEVLLGDFGIALISSSSTSRSTKTAAGTVSYMAPEQILGKPCIASDQYALGIVVYEWLCGTLPFRGSFAEVGQQHLYASPPSLEEQGVEIAPSVEAVVRKALAKKPEERFANVQEFAMALEESFLHPETGLTSVSVLPRTESDVIISIQGEDRQQGKLIGVRKTTEPLVPAVPVPLVTTHLPRRRFGIKRNLIGILGLLFLILLVTSIVLYKSLFAVPSLAMQTKIQVQPTLVSVPTSPPKEAPQTVPTQAPQSVPTQAPQSVPTQAPQSVPTQAPQPVQRQLSSQQTQSQTTRARGSVTIAATHATGTLQYCVGYSIQQGTIFSNYKHTVQVMIDATITFTINTTNKSCGTVPAHAVQAGSIGNIPAEDMTQEHGCCGGGGLTNKQPFTGGQDAQTYTVVQQSDIDGAAEPLKTATAQTATANIQQQLRTNEHLVGNTQCTSNVTSDYNAGDRATQVTVTVATTCTATTST